MAHAVVHWEIGGHDLAALRNFYGELFAWKLDEFDADYTLVPAADGGIGGGLMRLAEDVPAYVTVYVEVDDLDATLARAGDLGATTVVPPTPIPGVGAFALFRDPEGNVVGILAPAR